MSKRTRFDKAVKTYQRHMERKGCSDRTVHGRETELSRLRIFLFERGIEDPCEVKPADLDSFLVWLTSEYKPGLARGTIERYIVVLRGFFGFLQSERMMFGNPAGHLTYPRKQRIIHRDFLSKEEMSRLLDVEETPVGLRTGALIRLMLMSGLRASEVVSLSLRNVDLKNREIEVRSGKGNKDRIVFFNEGTRQQFARYLVSGRPRLKADRTTAFILRDSGEPASRNWLWTKVKQQARQAGIAKRISPHSLRRSYATMLLPRTPVVPWEGCPVRDGPPAYDTSGGSSQSPEISSGML